MKKIFILLLLSVTQLSSYDTNSHTTLKVMKVKASKILTDFQGEEHSQFNAFQKLNPLTKLYDRHYSKQVIPQSYIMKYTFGAYNIILLLYIYLTNLKKKLIS